MIKTKAKAVLNDQVGALDVEFDVNAYRNNKQWIKITLGGKTAVILKDELWNFVFSIVTADKQAKMVPVKQEEMVKYVKQHTVELQKDMKKGDIMAVNCEVNVRQEVENAIRREKEEESLSTISPYSENVL